MTTIVFDLGNVLIAWDPRRLYRKLIADEAAMERFLAEVCTPAWNLEMDAGRPCAEAVAEKIAAFPAERALIEAWHGRWIETIGGPIGASVRLLERLHAEGARLLALSNWSAETFALIRHEPDYRFLDRFEKIYLSGALRMVKPHPEIFQHLLEDSGEAAGDCLFVDDSAANIETARRLGFQTHRFAPPPADGAPALEADLKARGLLA
ncbi:MAG: HAD family phosphatase [Geminicoccaceae bacterium]|nr:HAD family phosphatase [Geminicoccaceae bacterium]